MAIVSGPPVFLPERRELPDDWPPCGYNDCRSVVGIARIDAPYGPIRVECENGHYRKFEKKMLFTHGGKYGGLFSDQVIGASTRDVRRSQKLEPNERRRSEVLEDSERCSLCGAPPIIHPFRPEQDVKTDKELWS